MSRFARYRTGVLTVALLTIAGVYLAAIEFDPDNPMGLGDTTAIDDATVAGHAVRDNGRPILEALNDVPSRLEGRAPIVWTGNSQLHSVNAIQPGDTISSVYLHRELNGETFPGDYPVFGISYPNLSFEEQFVLLAGLALQPEERRPALLIQGVFLNDTRETGVRSRLRPLLRAPAVAQWVGRSHVMSARADPALVRLYRDLVDAWSERRNEEGFEAYLVREIGPHIPIFQRRSFIYAAVTYHLFSARNVLFGIDTSARRPILKGRYDLSMGFLEMGLTLAREQGVEVLLYNVPLRPDVDSPYSVDDYDRFRREVRTIAQRHGVRFVDYDALIPAKLWGQWRGSGQPDFTHFTAAGHRILARQVQRDIGSLIGLPDAPAEDGPRQDPSPLRSGRLR